METHTDGKGGKKRRGKRPQNWEAGRRPERETPVPRHIHAEGLQPAWGWPRGESVTRTSFAGELWALHLHPPRARWGVRLELHRPENSTEDVTRGPKNGLAGIPLKLSLEPDESAPTTPGLRERGAAPHNGESRNRPPPRPAEPESPGPKTQPGTRPG